MSSKRLPGKVLMPLHGKPILQWVIEAAIGAKLVDQVVVATSTNKEDQEIDIICNKLPRIPCFRGSLDDVLDRFYQAALHYEPIHIVRLTGDCPMLKAGIIDDTIRFHLAGNYEYTSNFQNKTFETFDGANASFFESRVIGTDGLSVEVFTMAALFRAAKLATSRYDREHVTPYIRRSVYTGVFLDYLISDQKLSVDTPEDYERIKGLMEC